MISIYEQRGIEQGIEKGMQQGLAEGMARGKRETLVHLLEFKFGELPASVRTRLEQITDTQELDRLSPQS